MSSGSTPFGRKSDLPAKNRFGRPKASVHCPGKCQERCAHPSEPELPPQPAVGPSVVAWHARSKNAAHGVSDCINS